MWVHRYAAVFIISMLAVGSRAASFRDLEERQSTELKDTMMMDSADSKALDSYDDMVPDLNSGMNIFDNSGEYKEEADTESEYMKTDQPVPALDNFPGVSLDTYTPDSSHDAALLKIIAAATIPKEIDKEDNLNESSIKVQVNWNTNPKVTTESNVIKQIIEEIRKAILNQTLTININIKMTGDEEQPEPPRSDLNNPVYKDKTDHIDNDQKTHDWLEKLMRGQIDDMSRAGPSNHYQHEAVMSDSDYMADKWLNNYYNRAL